MAVVLALETATDACSVALWDNGSLTERHEVAPRQHSALVFRFLRELVPAGDLVSRGVDAIAWGCGPGSFTGLRIAAATVQGMAYATGLPTLPVPTLAILAQSALSQGLVTEGDTLLCTLDARLNEVYCAVYGFAGGLPVLRAGPQAAPPANVRFPVPGPLIAVGSGSGVLESFPGAIRAAILAAHPGVLPAARDALPLALDLLAQGATCPAGAVSPLYVRDDIGWKKLREQGGHG